MASIVNKTEIWILDGNLNLITKLLEPLSMNSRGMILQYSKELDDFGQCRFRVSAYDTLLKKFGDILVPHKNWIRLVRGGVTIWQGAIIENIRRTKDYWEIIAAEPLWYFSKILINRSSLNPAGSGPTAVPTAFSMVGNSATLTFTSFPTNATPALNGQLSLSGFTPAGINGIWTITAVTANTVTVNITGGPFTVSTMGSTVFSDGVYRMFDNHLIDTTMGGAVTNLINETITTFKSGDAGHALANMTLGTVTNPNYPPNITDGNNPARQLTGPWNFGDGVSSPKLQFDFHPLIYVLKSFGNYTYSNFYLDNNLVFNFVPFKGNNLSNKVSFVFGGPTSQASNIVDYNIPRLGQRMYNDLYGIATDINGLVLHYDGSDQASIATYGLIQGVAAYSDVKDQATLNARIQAEVPLISTPDNAAISVTLNEKGYPLGVYDIGDIVNISITHRGINFSDARRVVGITVMLHNTGRETTTVQTNKVLPFQFAFLGSPQ